MKRIGPILTAFLLGTLPLYSQIVTINGDSLISHDEAEHITYLRLKMKFNGNNIRYFTCVD